MGMIEVENNLVFVEIDRSTIPEEGLCYSAAYTTYMVRKGQKIDMALDMDMTKVPFARYTIPISDTIRKTFEIGRDAANQLYDYMQTYNFTVFISNRDHGGLYGVEKEEDIPTAIQMFLTVINTEGLEKLTKAKKVKEELSKLKEDMKKDPVTEFMNMLFPKDATDEKSDGDGEATEGRPDEYGK